MRVTLTWRSVVVLSTQVVKQNCTSFCATLRCMHTKRKVVVYCVAWYAQTQTNKQTLKFFLNKKSKLWKPTNPRTCSVMLCFSCLCWLFVIFCFRARLKKWGEGGCSRLVLNSRPAQPTPRVRGGVWVNFQKTSFFVCQKWQWDVRSKDQRWLNFNDFFFWNSIRGECNLHVRCLSSGFNTDDVMSRSAHVELPLSLHNNQCGKKISSASH